ncbi:Tim44 domain-containing protein [Paucibacter sp. Y2R2-4]|uniref:Tim44 domain-containing protein n=1 Tax=Paucibacter sp. Y2R2-4 TaxID=2893553 RepID=UPI0021E382D6|nr:Tim44-like domain-containing protein [Paucibacter sp. Y2R2-4]MCV2352092.1 39S ribosomal protein L45 [Paucibacter sp. Y2R2-4]
MKRFFVLSAAVAVLAMSLTSFDAEAKRLGGGGSSGMKRATPQQTHDASKGTPPQQAATPAPQQAAPATPGAAAAPAAAAAPKRNWMGPIAGLAAGLGIAALASHFGLGGALANMMTMLLIGVAVMFVIGFIMRRMAANKAKPEGMQFAGAGAPFPTQTPMSQPASQTLPPQNAFPAPASAPVQAPAGIPVASQNLAPAHDGFDAAGFEQLAKRVFIRLQAANDAGDQADLRRFTTPEMYGVIQQDLLDRKGAKQSTEVLQLDAKVIERAQDDGQQIVSVRFWGLIREQSDAAAENFDEVWHLVRPVDESREWAIAGIQATA